MCVCFCWGYRCAHLKPGELPGVDVLWHHYPNDGRRLEGHQTGERLGTQRPLPALSWCCCWACWRVCTPRSRQRGYLRCACLVAAAVVQVLSTASPAVGGVPPTLTTKYVSLGHPWNAYGGYRGGDKFRSLSSSSSAPAPAYLMTQNAMMFDAPAPGAMSAAPPSASVATARVSSDGGASALFAIERLTTIAR